MIVAAVGNAIAAGTTNKGARFFAMFLMPMGAVSACESINSPHVQLQPHVSILMCIIPDQIIVSWVANSFPRPLAKRSATIAICNMIGNTATIYGSYMYPASMGPRYIPGGSANAAVCVIVALLALTLRYVHKWENKKLDRAEQEQAASGEAGLKVPVEAAAGRAGARFRYVY
jgi:hypothetical protein